MVEVLVEFDTTVRGTDGVRWAPRACGGVAAGGLWEGWVEFMPHDDTIDPVRTPRETEQPNRTDLIYWAQGLTQAYLEFALQRALEPPPRARFARASVPHFGTPSPHRPRMSGISPRPVLNPFEVYSQGEYVLLRELRALDVARIRDIVVAYGLLDPSAASGRSREELTAAIIAGVRYPMTGGPPQGGGVTL
jgi:hypothetical protein